MVVRNHIAVSVHLSIDSSVHVCLCAFVHGCLRQLSAFIGACKCDGAWLHAGDILLCAQLVVFLCLKENYLFLFSFFYRWMTIKQKISM